MSDELHFPSPEVIAQAHANAAAHQARIENDRRDPFNLGEPTGITPLTPAEERILRATIDEPHIFDVPKRTVKRLLALIDVLRKMQAGSDEAIRHSARAAAFVAKDVTIAADTYVAEANESVKRIVFDTDGGVPRVRIVDGDTVHFLAGDPATILRERFAANCFEMPNGAFRAGAEIADLIDRGALP